MFHLWMMMMMIMLFIIYVINISIVYVYSRFVNIFDADQIASEFMKMNRSDVSVKTPRRMVARSQTQRTGEYRLDGPSARPNP
jgi:hypothetical protein